jgi:calpain-7
MRKCYLRVNILCFRQWAAGVGPVKDLYSIGDNPQYSLDVNSAGHGGAVWILLTRHITDKVSHFTSNLVIVVIAG